MAGKGRQPTDDAHQFQTFDCPVCSGNSGVKDSRPTTYGRRRRRVCEDCGLRFTTRELYESKYAPLPLVNEIMDDLGQMEQALTRAGDRVRTARYKLTGFLKGEAE